MTRDECLSRVDQIAKQDEPSFPIFIDVGTYEAYRQMQEWLEHYSEKNLSVADFIGEDVAIDLGNILTDIRSSIKGIMVTGLSAYLNLRPQEDTVAFIRDTEYCVTKNGACFILTYGMKNAFGEFIRQHSNPHWKERFLVIDEDEYVVYHQSYVFFEQNLKDITGVLSEGLFANSLPEFIKSIDGNPKGMLGACVNKRQLESLASVRHVKILWSPFEVLEFYCHDIPSTIKSSMGTDEQWGSLISQIQKTKSWKALFYGFFDNETPEDVLSKKWITLDKNKRWLLFLGLKTYNIKSFYLTKILECTWDVQTFVKKLYSLILSFDVNSPNFRQMYDERKRLIDGVRDMTQLKTFVALSKKVSGKNRLFYLTDRTLDEQKAVFECLAERPELYEGFVNGEFKYIFPALADYASHFDFTEEAQKYSKYFEEYRRQKVCNFIAPEFLKIVAEEAAARSYNLLPTRDSEFSHYYQTGEGIKVIWIDALGVEFLAYLKRKSTERGLAMKMSVGRANVPTITSLNKQFLDNIPDVESLKKLDTLKHDGDEALNNELKLPFYLIRELQILDEIVDKIHGYLTNGYKKVIVVSDHGATRLPIVLGKERLTYAMESKGRHGGRCCAALPSMTDTIDEATKENGYFVLADYNRFKGGNTGQFENHGGATLEEVVTPIVEFKLGVIHYQVMLVQEKITVKRGQPVCFSIVVVPTPQVLSVRIGETTYPVTPVGAAPEYFEVILDENTKSGEYKVTVIADNEELSDKLKLFITRGGVIEKNLF